MTTPAEAVVLFRFAASSEHVFNAWFDPALIVQWMFGPNVRDERILRIQLDPRVGGRFSFVVDRHGTEVEHVGEYLWIDQHRRLVFTWATRERLAPSSRVTVEITDLDHGCDVKLTHAMAPEWADLVDRSAAAWTRMLAALVRVFVRTLPTPSRTSIPLLP